MTGLHANPPTISLSIMVDRETLCGKGRGIFFGQADSIQPTDVNLMARNARGIISAAISATRAYQLGLPPLTNSSRRREMPPYIVSVEAAACAETGISADERALTLRTLGSPAALSEDLVTPGHIMPIIVPEEIGADSSLAAVAFHYAKRRGDALAIAWCDVLDETGDVASSLYCTELARSLKLPVLVRISNTVTDYLSLLRSGEEPQIIVMAGGLDIAQFA
ncbi:MAG: 3,4-dihydroxy-2-butanone-4-phosphate synthase [Rhodospirillaceae bacterium]|nr:3,4-dihydroxy-2-butanone-4-phosphate synthase [Rhodospirillaceae bacterium]